jgi:alpha-tubulin suppressor-like RCC1 family protein
VLCWGRDESGELGDGGGEDRLKPALVGGVDGAAEIALGSGFSCARVVGGAATCWGTGSIDGTGAAAKKARPTAVKGVSGATAIDAGGLMTCATLPAGRVHCWGDAATEPALVDGGARCWGDDPWNADLAQITVDGAQSLTTGDSFACALHAPGNRVACWGRNEQGELGAKHDANLHAKARDVEGVTHAERVVAGEAHACAITTGGALHCWGSNTDGELGRGTRTATEGAAEVKGLPAITDVALGADHACALTETGDVYCWGSNSNGQLGDGTKERRLAPVKVTF